MESNVVSQLMQSPTPNCAVNPSQSHSIIYVYDLVEQRIISASASVAALLGYSADEIEAMGSMGLASLMHPDDLDRVAEYYQRLTTLLYEEVISIVYRMRQPDGAWCWLRSQETPLICALDGFSLQISGITLRLNSLLDLQMWSETENHNRAVSQC